jgi:pyruvate formate-lyase/glycerol dehydratase family glycyl radical enzyme
MVVDVSKKSVNEIGRWEETFVRVLPQRVQKARERVLKTPEICLEHARAEIKAYTHYKDQPRIIQRAHVFATHLKEKSISIFDDELIVGNVTSKARASAIFAEYYANFLDKEIDDPVKDPQARLSDRHIIHSDERKELRDVIIPFFKGKCLEDYTYASADEEVRDKGFIMTASCPHLPGYSDLLTQRDAGHMVVNYEKVLYKGLKGIKEEAEAYQAELSKPYDHYNVEARRNFYKATIITLNAAINYIKRFAAKEQNTKRKAELKTISGVCDWISEKPARNWWEAVQLAWFIQNMLWCEQNNAAPSYGRLDQYMYPFYKKSVIDDKAMTRDEALELLECFWVKNCEITLLYTYEQAQINGGFGVAQNILLGGQTCDGKDACNDVTMLCLEAEEQVGLIQPEVAMRVWEGTPTLYLKQAIKIVRLGRGKMKFYSDRTAIEMMKKAYPDYTIEDLRDYAVIGCIELCLPHITMQHSFAGLFNIAKAVELVVNNGKCAICGEQVGLLTGDPHTFQSMNGVKQAFEAQVANSMNYLFRALRYEMMGLSKFMQCPFSSALHEGPLQKGLDVIEGGAWWTKYGVLVGGLADAADSLTTIDKLIFRDKKVTWDQLLQALKDNWEGHEDLKQMVINDVPKYGNDDDYADDFAAFVMDTWYDTIDWANTQKNLLPPFGGEFTGAILIGNGAVGMGPMTAALPNGHSFPNPIADTMSPVQGADKNGPTAVIKSVSKMPSKRFTMGTALNQRLTPQLLATDRDIDNFVAFIRTCEELGVFHIQFNIVKSETLRRAMKEPEKFKDLTIRVASFVSYFCELDPRTQLDIINRTEHQNW